MKEKEIILKGIPAAPGIASGQAFILDKQEFIITPRSIMDQEVSVEIARFEEALIKTKAEIVAIKARIELGPDTNPASIFDAHLMFLEDRSLLEEVIKKIRDDKLSAEYVLSEVIKKYVGRFAKIEDEYLRERVSDVNDVGKRVLKSLIDENKMYDFDNITEETIVVSHDLSPSDTAGMHNKNIIAFATDIGGRTSHTAIMAKSLGIPAVVGVKDATLRIHNQDYIIVDGRKGLVVINPTEETKSFYKKTHDRILEFRDRFREIKDLPTETLDGRRVKIEANLEIPEELPNIIEQGAEGLGLYRTEYFYMNRVDLPSEEEQFEAYKKVVMTMTPNSVTIRSLDLGGDKFISSLEIPRDMFPYLGWRAIRFCFARPDIFKTQLRAVLRASAFGKIKLMYPMISGPEELRKANTILNEVKLNLREENISFDENMPVGVMIELPSAAMTADLLAKEADFFSIGTNDLIQYTLAVDRVNEQTAELYEPGHPGVLRLIKRTIDAGALEDIPVGLCGEMANEPALALILLGFGLNEFSMSPMSVLQIKNLVRSVSFRDAKKLANEILELSTGKEVEEMSTARLQQLAPDIIRSEQGD